MRVGLVSLGCPKNLVDSEVMLGLAQDAGHELTADPSSADVLVVNTCAFIDSAKRESIDAILEMAALKNEVAGRRLIVTGCLAERYRAELKAEIPEIDAILGTGEVPEIVAAIGGSGATPLPFYRSSKPEIIRASTLAPGTLAPGTLVRGTRPTYLYDADTPRLLATPRHYAYLKVAEGCDYKCAFCIIPTLRGPYRSRPADSIVREARRLADRGVKELLLISQDTTFYGIDRRERGALAALLGELNDIDGLEWIRLLYLYPTTIDDGVLRAMAECEKVCKYIDLPLQHAADRVLQRMKRPGTRRGYDTLLTRIRTIVPDVALRTTFIVGFPGETEEDVQELLEFVDDHQFEHVGVFTYSHEEGTSAYDLPDDVPEQTKGVRRARIMHAQKQIVDERNRRRVGSVVQILVDGPATEHELVLKGRLRSQAPDIDAAVFLTECDPSTIPAGTLAPVQVVAAHGYDLVARPIAGCPGASST